MDFTIELALVDYVPVLFFAIAAAILCRDLRGKMNGLSYLMTLLGTSAVAVAGACKATWKLLYAAGIGDIVILNKMFFPTQSIGFLLAGFGMLALIFGKKNRLYGVSTFAFIGMMVAGLGIMDAALAVVAKRLGKGKVALVFLLSFICSLCMGYLSSKDFSSASMNWLAEGINIVGQGSLLLGVISLHKAGLGDK